MAPYKAGLRLSGETIALMVVLAVVVVGAAAKAGAVHIGSKVAGAGPQLPKNPAG